MVTRPALSRSSFAPVPQWRTGTTFPYLSLALYLSVALVTRAVLIGKPAFHVDEQFYLLVGQRMAQGALPYVDLWDRKPWGLFEIYRSVFLLPFDPVLTYQTLGLACSVLTALVIERTASLIAPPNAARLAGVLYLLWGCIFNIALGQSPAFYNLLVATAGLIVVEAQLRARARHLMKRGVAAMLLLGLAIQIKYTVVFEGAGLGLMLLSRAWSDGYSRLRLLLTAILWMSVALLPTGLVLLYYTALGHADVYIYANFVSIFERSTGFASSLRRLRDETLVMIPFILALLVAPRRMPQVRGTEPASLPWLNLWAVASFVGFLAFGTWYDHYVSPMLVPFSILAARCLARPNPKERWYGRLLLGVGVIGAFYVPINEVRTTGTPAEFTAASTAIANELHGRCLYIYEGDSALYRTTNACIPTAYGFPTHLSTLKESEAMGIDTAKEERKVLASRPGVIVMDHNVRLRKINKPTYTLVHEELLRSYERYAIMPLGKRRYELWRLKKDEREG